MVSERMDVVVKLQYVSLPIMSPVFNTYGFAGYRVPAFGKFRIIGTRPGSNFIMIRRCACPDASSIEICLIK